MASSIELSLITCVYNEEDNIQPFLDRVLPILKQCVQSYELIFVDDGSRDKTLENLINISKQNPNISVIKLSRNFGKDKAMTAALDLAGGQAIIPIDVDLQDPPELIPEMIAEWKAGSDMVVGIRSSRNDESWLKRKTADWFYRFINRISNVAIPANAGDYRLLSRKVLNIIHQMPERTRFMKGLFAYAGFKTTYVSYQRPARTVGITKWNFWKLWNFALDGIFGFSSVPLRIWTYVGITTALLSFFYMIYLFIRTLVDGVDVPGYASLMMFILFFNSLLMISIGILGEYIGRIFDEVKGRPVYIIDKIYGNLKPN